MTTLPVTAQQAYISLRANLGYPDYTNQPLINFVSSTTFTAAALAINEVTVSANTTDQAVNLSTLFPALSNLLFVMFIDITTPGQPFSITSVSGSGRLSVAANSFYAYMPNTSSGPTLYLTNANSTSSLIQIAVLSN